MEFDAKMIQQHKSRVWIWFAVGLPVLYITLSIGVSQYNQQAKTQWSFPLQAYDPRDILRGKYLNVRLSHELTNPTCTTSPCCVCLSQADFSRNPPRLSTAACSSVQPTCPDWMQQSDLASSYRYFIPEARSLELETRIQEASQAGRAQVHFVLDAKHHPQLTKLTIDGVAIE